MKQAIVIPAFNEVKTIASVLKSLEQLSEFDVVVVDDGSVDGTGAEVKRFPGVVLLTLSSNLGAWKAMQTGIRFCYTHGYDRVVTFDADGQHIPATIPKLIKHKLLTGSDVVIGSCTQRGSLARHIAWRFFRLLSGIKVFDITSGLRIYNKDAISVLSSKQATLLEYQDVGVLLMLKSYGLTFTELKVAMKPRQDGISRIFHSWWAVAFYMAHTTLLCLSKIRKNHRLADVSSHHNLEKTNNA
ncbi:glycosyltransferase family 2 protein [Shewanella waksmanii]|uniref:glycosyltransferase family 2 protein n=1 Tax=Shewanella waksmanii TaxID=213783 RepID=UPI00048B47DF|nr:glycosyltransferase family 2 protein [Shewanella waksmanii]